jgi:hypothetical protein
MKRSLAILLLVLVALIMLFACSKGYESQKTAEDLKITLSVDRYPLVKGDNDIKVKVTDASGKSVANAAVSVRYFMPPMPGMAPMDFTTQAFFQGDRYGFVANIPMEGGWKAEVTVARPGQQAAASVTYNLDAR